MNALPAEVAGSLIGKGADALIDAFPGMTHLQAFSVSAVVLAATFPPSAVLVAQQAARRASQHRDGDPVGAVSDYVVELQAKT